MIVENYDSGIASSDMMFTQNLMKILPLVQKF